MAVRSASFRLATAAARSRCRAFSDYGLGSGGGPETLEELLDTHLDKQPGRRRRLDEDDPVDRRRLLSSRREALSLYRDIFRASRAFVWPNQEGIPWRDVLRASARREFEQARYESDPEVIARLIVVGRDAVEAAVDKLVESMTKEAGIDKPRD